MKRIIILSIILLLVGPVSPSVRADSPASPEHATGPGSNPPNGGQPPQVDPPNDPPTSCPPNFEVRGMGCVPSCPPGQVSNGNGCSCPPGSMTVGSIEGSNDARCAPNRCDSARFRDNIECTGALCDCEDSCVDRPIYRINVRPRADGTPTSVISGSVPQCLRDMARRCGIQGNSTAGYGTVGVGVPAFVDDCLVCAMKDKTTVVRAGLTRTACVDHINVPGNPFLASTALARQAAQRAYLTFSVDLDENCNFLSNTPYVCSTAQVDFIDSPISLHLAGTFVDNNAATVVQFDLAGEGVKWYTWRASKNFPPLVYDPKRTGVIKSGKQLFGTHTFGKTWKHGYHALAVMDTDRDGTIEKEELEPLSVWQDENRDGVSDPGEVVPVQEIGITKLFYQPSRTEGNDVIADHGFERRLSDGTRIKGASVDWFAASYDSKEEAVVKEQLRRNDDRLPEYLADQVAPRQLEPLASSLDAFPNMTVAPQRAGSTIAGTWRWRITSGTTDAGTVPSWMGVLGFNEVPGHPISGHSYVELDVPQSRRGVSRTVVAIPLAGYRSASRGGSTGFVFDSVSARDRTRSVAVLSSDGKRLTGKSTSGTGLAYEWVAERMS